MHHDEELGHGDAAPGDHHPAGVLDRLRHRFAGLAGGHSHDSADQVDAALEAHAEGRRALLLSLVVLAATAAFQGVVVVATGSVALLGDTLHNVADALTAVPLLVAFRLGLRPASRRFTYGYGRSEDLAGLVVILVIALSAGLAVWEAVHRLLDPEPVAHLWAVALAAVVGFLGNEGVAAYRIRVGRRIGSAALVADGLHARADGLTSLAVLLGVGGSALGWQLADPIVALAITVAVLGVLRSAVAQVGGRLLDAVEPTLVDRARSLVEEVPGVAEVRSVRLRWTGHTLHAQLVVAVDGALQVNDSDTIAAAVRGVVAGRLSRVQEVSVAVEPASVLAISG
jgi:cation diffusion facilitator family transporter